MLGIRPRLVRAVRGPAGPEANANWHVWPLDGERVVLRCYHSRATPSDLAYEHRVMAHLAGRGWSVPVLLSPLVEHAGRWWCLTRFVVGRARRAETARQQGQRGEVLARLHLDLRALASELGQRPGWRAQHRAVTVHTDIDWHAGLAALETVDPGLAEWASTAADLAADDLLTVGAHELAVTVVHGDFAEWNVHYQASRLGGVIDFGLTHLDSRPYELAIARTYRAPEVIEGYRKELERLGWSLSDLETAALRPLYHAFRVDMTAWHLDHARRTGQFDLDFIRAQLARTGAPPPRQHANQVV